MKLAYIHPDDVIEVNKGGRRMYGRVVEIRGKLQCSRCRTICETCCEGGRG